MYNGCATLKSPRVFHVYYSEKVIFPNEVLDLRNCIKYLTLSLKTPNRSVYLGHMSKLGKLETSYFSFDQYDWSLSVYPAGKSESQLGK